MSRQLQYVNGNYELPLLLKNSVAILLDSYSMVVRRLQSLKRRLIKDPDLHRRYTDQMESNIQKGIQKRYLCKSFLPGLNNGTFLINRLLTPKNQKRFGLTTIALLLEWNGKSLNDFFMKGHDLMNSLVGVLLRFRRERLAIVAYVETMFYQIRVNSSDRDASRFLLWSQGNLNDEPFIYRMTVHLFGAKTFPSCASFCLRQTAKEFGKYFDSQISEIVFKNFYVYDSLINLRKVTIYLLTSCNTEERIAQNIYIHNSNRN